MTIREIIEKHQAASGLSMSYPDMAEAITNAVASGEIKKDEVGKAIEEAAAMYREEVAAELQVGGLIKGAVDLCDECGGVSPRHADHCSLNPKNIVG